MKALTSIALESNFADLLQNAGPSVAPSDGLKNNYKHLLSTLVNYFILH